jgi:8-oxo-dGTP diphosphatase
MQQVHVAVGIIRKDNAVFIAKRKANQHQGDKWEFPGGKVEPNETTFEALHRELFEEVGLEIIDACSFCNISFEYPDKSVLLEVLEVLEFVGTPYGKEGQDAQWCDMDKLVKDKFPQANREIIQLLKNKYLI